MFKAPAALLRVYVEALVFCMLALNSTAFFLASSKLCSYSFIFSDPGSFYFNFTNSAEAYEIYYYNN